jgi:hypothetical protein
MSAAVNEMTDAPQSPSGSLNPSPAVAVTTQHGWSAFDVWRERVWRRPDIANLPGSPQPAAVIPRTIG